MPQWFLVLAAGLFGLLFGSFANVVIWRFPRGESLVSPGSHCASCGAPVAWYDNIPVVSYFVLGGRCRACGAPFSVRYPVVEVASGVLWATAAAAFSPALATVFGIAFFYLLLILSVIDLDHYRLPNLLVGLLGVIGIVGVALGEITGVHALPLVWPGGSGWLGSPIASAVAGVLLGGGIPALAAWLYALMRHRQGLGMGDVKLLGVMGLYLGPYVAGALLVGSLVGVVFGLATKRGEALSARKIPFGPFLAAGAVVTALVGDTIWTAYLSAVGIVP